MIRLPHVALIALLPLELLANPELDDMFSAEDAFLDELPVILSATRLTQPLNESPVAMTVIDREMIDASGARTIPDLLRLVPGFQVGYYDGNSPVATYHGHSNEHSKRVQVMVDGRSVYVPSLAGIPWQDMVVSVDDIDRIEVTRGPNASTYGNNSFSGVVNIFTRHAIEDQGHKITAITGSKDTTDAYYRFGSQLGNLDYRVTVGTKNDDGTDFLNDYTEADYLSYRLDYQIDTDNHLSYQGGLKDILKGDHEPVPDHEIDVAYAFQWLKWEHQISDKQSLSLQYYYNYHDQKEFIKTVTIPDTPFGPFTIDGFSLDSTLNIKSERHDLEFNHHYDGDILRLVSGLSARLDIVDANDVFDEDGEQHNNLYRAFTHGEYTITDSWLFNAGLMIENNDISGTDVSPRVAVIHKLNDKHSFRIGASRATRTPVLWEEHANYRLSQTLTNDGTGTLDPAIQTFLGGTDVLTNQFVISSGNLESEEITSYELGYIAQLLNKKLTLDFKLFKDETDNLIGVVEDVFAPDDNYDVAFGGESSPIADDWQNSFRTEMEGLETSFNYQHSKDFRVYGYYAYIDIQAEMFNPLARTHDIRRFTVSAPTNSYGLMLIKHWQNNLHTSLSYFRVGDMDWMDRTGSTGFDYEDRSAQAYNKLDLNISKIYKYGTEKLKISLTLQNLIEDFYDYNKTRYEADNTTVYFSPDSSISPYGSLQDTRAYLELTYLFN
ncbi:MAG: TonB-dependent receptor [Gammaproteobacteria bacterium]|nr:TonB-dependent receptor [Gammaproteobacteria bacterium]